MKMPADPRTSVEVVRDVETGKAFLRGTETCDRDRANVFGAWPGNEDDFDYGGRFYLADSSSPVGIEVEVRFAFADHADIDDHAEVYLWQAYDWDLIADGPVCRKDDAFHGEYVVEAGGIDGPFSIFSTLVGRSETHPTGALEFRNASATRGGG